MDTKLYKHQEKALKILKGKKRYALFMEQGTGKTLVAIKRLEKLIKLKKVERVIIITLSAVVPNWYSELNTFLKDTSLYDIIIYEGTAPKRKALIKGKPKKPQIIIMNYEKVRIDKKELCKYRADMLILDESQKVKGRTSQVTKATLMLSRRASYVYLLTGTPIGVGYQDIYSQFLIMNPNILGTRWADFEDEYMIKGGYMGKEIVGYRNLSNLKRLIKKNSFRVKKSECLDLPPVTTQNLYCELGTKARKAYNELNKEMMTMVEGKLINSLDVVKKLSKKNKLSRKELIVLDTALIKSMKLQQITGGFIRNEEGEDILLDKSKLNLLVDIIETSSKPVIVFCKYRAEITTIQEYLKKQKYKVAELSGKTKDKGMVVKDFQKGKKDVIIVQIKTGSAGINLTKASTAIFYSWTSSYIDLDQAKARLHRIGQTNPINIYFLISKDTVDELSLKVLSDRTKMVKKVIR